MNSSRNKKKQDFSKTITITEVSYDDRPAILTRDAAKLEAANGNLSNNMEESLLSVSMSRDQMKPHQQTSLVGPKEPGLRQKFLIMLFFMEICGASNDFLAKTMYQLIPGYTEGIDGFKKYYWATIGLTGVAFAASSVALIAGRESFNKLTCQSLIRIIVPAVMDLFVTGGRYLGLVFLPAAVVTILKNGLQLFFLSLIRVFFLGKKFGVYQWLGLFILFFGLIIVMIHDLLSSSDSSSSSSSSGNSLSSSIFGVSLMVFVGFAGAVRNTMEEILLKKYEFNSNFVVGMESLTSLFSVLILSIIVLQISTTEDWNDIGPGIAHVLTVNNHGIVYCLCIFVFVFYGKDTLQMKVTQLSSAMTRKLFQQLYPINTWILSLILHAIVSDLGEGWDNFAWIQLIGFCVVLYGTFVYYTEPLYGMPKFLRDLCDLDAKKRLKDKLKAKENTEKSGNKNKNKRSSKESNTELTDYRIMLDDVPE